MTMTVRAVLVGVLLVTAGCGVDDLPESQAFTGCLESAGVDPDELGGAEERREAFADPAALDCVVYLPSPTDREAALGGVFEDVEDFWPVLVDWIAAQEDRGREKIADDAGRLLGGADGDGSDEDDEFEEGWSKEAMNAGVAVAAWAQAEGGLPPAYDVWRAEKGEDDAEESPELDDYTEFIGWLQDGDPDLWLEIDDLQDWVRKARDD